MSHCTYCLGRGKVHGPSLLSYIWWRLGGRLYPQRCPECKGTGEAQPGQCTYPLHHQGGENA
jgi:hypothetical protein